MSGKYEQRVGAAKFGDSLATVVTIWLVWILISVPYIMGSYKTSQYSASSSVLADKKGQVKPAALHSPGLGVYEWRRLDLINARAAARLLRSSKVRLDHAAVEVTYLHDAADAGTLDKGMLKLSKYVQVASRKGIAVRGLTGDLRMLQDFDRASHICELLGYYNSVYPQYAVTQLEYDVEPHALGSNWGQYVDELVGMYKHLDATCPDSVSVGATMPYWYYRVPTVFGSALDEVLIDETDFFVVMAYRQFLTGPNSVATARRRSQDRSAEFGKPYWLSVDFRSTEPGSYLSSYLQLRELKDQGGATVNSSFTVLNVK